MGAVEGTIKGIGNQETQWIEITQTLREREIEIKNGHIVKDVTKTVTTTTTDAVAPPLE
jgi:hypothetical protein